MTRDEQRKACIKVMHDAIEAEAYGRFDSISLATVEIAFDALHGIAHVQFVMRNWGDWDRDLTNPPETKS